MLRNKLIQPRFEKILKFINEASYEFIYEKIKRMSLWNYFLQNRTTIEHQIFEKSETLNSIGFYNFQSDKEAFYNKIHYIILENDVYKETEKEHIDRCNKINRTKRKDLFHRPIQHFLSKDTYNSVALSENIEIIHHKSEMPSRSNSRNRCSLTSQPSNPRGIKDGVEDQNNEINRHKTKESLQVALTKKLTAMENLKIIQKTTITSSKLGEGNGFFLNSHIGNDEDFPIEIDRSRIVDFSPDFVLSRVFGYQNVYIKTEEGVFDIFEPAKIKDMFLDGYDDFAVNILNGYKSESENLNDISSRSDYMNKSDTDSVIVNKYENKLMTPRSVIRKRTSNFLTPYKEEERYKEGSTFKEIDFLKVETSRHGSYTKNKSNISRQNLHKFESPNVPETPLDK